MKRKLSEGVGFFSLLILIGILINTNEKKVGILFFTNTNEKKVGILFFTNTSVDTEMCCPKGKCGCQYFILLT